MKKKRVLETFIAKTFKIYHGSLRDLLVDFGLSYQNNNITLHDNMFSESFLPLVILSRTNLFNNQNHMLIKGHYLGKK